MSFGNATVDPVSALQSYGLNYYFTLPPCWEWLPTNHYYFHLAMAFLLFVYFAPTGLYGLLFLRVSLTVSCVFFVLWGYFVLCSFDTLLWNVFFTGINFVHVCALVYLLWPVRLPADMEEVYRELFQPLRLSRRQFLLAAACVDRQLDLEPRESYSLEGVTPADFVALVLSGKLLTSQKGRPLQIVGRLEFLDSLEWFEVTGTGGTFHVTTTALEPSRLVLWNRDRLKMAISGDTSLQAAFNNLLGNDVAGKLQFFDETKALNYKDLDASSGAIKRLLQMKEAALASRICSSAGEGRN
ncbi:hypothetical protein HPB48_003386 [Haemaphysalis longicornis]|uniref:POPDC1-3 domain-containing protein n=1 Tax=Haemaphysalis longicornis TaxID=44386 RepID=A0A9J6GEU3_HAELO|nr:hypothetical protein HPB48_003386 [Haemaphysalis longicornis]